MMANSAVIAAASACFQTFKMQHAVCFQPRAQNIRGKGINKVMFCMWIPVLELNLIHNAFPRALTPH